ncbi:hypothetical protein RsTz2092_12350 [Deferribacterales bacterium RsTz2092]|nr:hypothetical protein AGMMS49941_10490 [Deferribacterales bacterium]
MRHFFFTRRFLPLFITQFFGAFSDNAFKNAIAILITYVFASNDSGRAEILVTISSGLFILPYFLFSSLAGELADKYNKAKLAVIYKIIEVVLMLFGTVGFIMHNSWFLLLLLFAMGAQSTFFGPIKYSILPQQLERSELMAGNAYVEGSTFVAVLVGTITGGVVILLDDGILLVGIILTLSAVVGTISSYFISSAEGQSPDIKVKKNIFSESYKLVRLVMQNRKMRLYLLLISWFWLVGSVFLAQTVIWVRHVLFADQTVVTMCMALFSVGIGAGSVFCSKLSRGEPNFRYVYRAAFAMAGLIAALVVSSGVVSPAAELYSVKTFLAHWHYLPIPFFLFAVAFCGGVYTVPLYTLMQREATSGVVSRTVAVNNILNSFFMVASVVLVVLIYTLGFTVSHVFALLAIATAFVASMAYRGSK